MSVRCPLVVGLGTLSGWPAGAEDCLGRLPSSQSASDRTPSRPFGPLETVHWEKHMCTDARSLEVESEFPSSLLFRAPLWAWRARTMVFVQSVRPGKRLAKESSHQPTGLRQGHRPLLGRLPWARLLPPLGQRIQDGVDLLTPRRSEMFLQMTPGLRLTVTSGTQPCASKARGMRGRCV